MTPLINVIIKKKSVDKIELSSVIGQVLAILFNFFFVNMSDKKRGQLGILQKEKSKTNAIVFKNL